MRRIPRDQPQKEDKDHNREARDHPKTIVPGKGVANDRPNWDPNNGSNTKTGKDPGNEASPLFTRRHKAGHHQDQRNDGPRY